MTPATCSRSHGLSLSVSNQEEVEGRVSADTKLFDHDNGVHFRIEENAGDGVTALKEFAGENIRPSAGEGSVADVVAVDSEKALEGGFEAFRHHGLGVERWGIGHRFGFHFIPAGASISPISVHPVRQAGMTTCSFGFSDRHATRSTYSRP